MRILIIGDSTIAWMRPHRNHKDEMLYSEMFAKSDVFLDMVCTPGMTSRDAVRYYWKNLLGKFYDYCIISVGINDLSPRSYPRWLWEIDNYFVVKERLIEKIYGFTYRVFTNTKLQKFFSYIGLSKPWISEREFEANLLKLQDLILKESSAKIIFISLPMVSQRVKKILYGIDKNIIAYKQIINKLYNNRTEILDVNKLFEDSMDMYNPEGIHYSALGHKIVFENLYKIIKSDESENTNNSRR